MGKKCSKSSHTKPQGYLSFGYGLVFRIKMSKIYYKETSIKIEK